MVFPRLLYILQRVILRVADGLAPLVAALLAGILNGDMAEPTVGLCAVPVLDVRGDGDDIAGGQALRGLAGRKSSKCNTKIMEHFGR